MTLEGAIDTATFEVFIEHCLAPTLQPGQVVIADNLSAHKRHKVQQMITDRGCTLLFLPTYSPDLNPIEMLWSQFKSHLRKEAARTQEKLDELIWPSPCPAAPSHIRNWSCKAGYA